MTWRIEFHLSAARELRKLDRQTKERLLSFLYDRVATADDPRLLAKPLAGPLSEYSRFRVGDYRIIVEFQDGIVTVLVLKIGNRREVYR